MKSMMSVRLMCLICILFPGVAMAATSLDQVQSELAQRMSDFGLPPAALSARHTVISDGIDDSVRRIVVQSADERVEVTYRGGGERWTLEAIAASAPPAGLRWQIGMSAAGAPLWYCTLRDGAIHGVYYQQRSTGTAEILFDMEAGAAVHRRAWDEQGGLSVDEALDPPLPWTYAPRLPRGDPES